MTGVAAVAMCAAFTSCSKTEDLYDPGVAQEMEIAEVYEQYNRAFIKTFGQVNPNVDWGFGKRAGTRANSGETYPETEAYHNMNHNEWADPDKEFGGYTVPDPLTEEQKAVVAAYFQTVPNLTYNDPHLRHFFIQQVYKGGNTKVNNTTEGITAASGAKYDSNNMNLLSVGQDNIHINNFNAGSCSESDVLKNGQHVGGASQKDQITLMVNIDDTSCFGYHETGSSTQHNNKAALVGWQTIHTWAQSNYSGYNGCLADNWNRSFVGFDLAIKEGAQAQSDVAAKYNDGPDGNYSYAKINNEIVTIDGNTSMNIYYLDTNTNMYVAAESKTISDADFIAEYRPNNDYKGKYINVDYLKSLIDEGWLPVKDKNLREWVKVGKSDGYFSDWIVTLTAAERQDPPSTNKVRIMAEDLNAQAIDGDIENSDWDFNDVVFDVEFVDPTGATSKAGTITLICAGGVLPLRVAGVGEVHQAFDSSLSQDPKTGWYPMINTGKGMGIDRPRKSFDIADADPENNGQGIKIEVEKTLKNGTKVWIELTAKKGQPCSKFAVKPTVSPCQERDHIDYVSDKAFSRYVANGGELIW